MYHKQEAQGLYPLLEYLSDKTSLNGNIVVLLKY